MAEKSDTGQHAGRPGPCDLCKNESEKYKLFNKLPEQAQTLILHNLPAGHAGPAGDACTWICYKCTKQVERNMQKKAHFQPRWLPKQNATVSVKKCSILGCALQVHCNTVQHCHAIRTCHQNLNSCSLMKR